MDLQRTQRNRGRSHGEKNTKDRGAMSVMDVRGVCDNSRSQVGLARSSGVAANKQVVPATKGNARSFDCESASVCGFFAQDDRDW